MQFSLLLPYLSFWRCSRGCCCGRCQFCIWSCSVQHLPVPYSRYCSEVFLFLYLACIKRPTLLWRLKEPNGSKRMQNQPQGDVQLSNILKLTVIYYNFHCTLIVKVVVFFFFFKAAYVMRNIPGITALGRRIWVFFMATHRLSVKMKTEQESVGWEQWYKSVCMSLQVKSIYR